MFHSLKIRCPRCGKEGTLTKVEFSAKGEVRFSLICILEGIELTHDSSWEQIIITCSQSDGEKLILNEVSKELQ